jgi:allantoin racemase
VQSIAYILPIVGIDAEELRRREHIANELTTANVEVIQTEGGPASIESEVEHEWSVPWIGETIRRHEADFDAFVVGCFGDPGVATARELTDTPVVGPSAATFHTAAQISNRFSCLTIRETPVSKQRQVHREHLTSRVASVRTVDIGVLDVDHDPGATVERMIDEATAAVVEDGAEAVVPGCMSLAYMQVHNEISAEVGVPFLDPLAISLETATTWARQGIRHSSVTYPPFDDARYETLFD